MYPVGIHILCILYTDKKPFGFLIFRLTRKLSRKKSFNIENLTGNKANGVAN
jgi:hypothetical protein